jgi:hypothetical protein
MLSATFYIMWCTAKNRMRRRLLRLREPRYLIGAAVGSAYLFFAVFGRMRTRRFTGRGSRGPAPTSFLPAFGAAGPALGGLALLLAAAVSWLMPFSSGLLDFTKAETEFLFAAPISRRQLLLYRLVRSQWAVFFGAVIVALTYPAASVSTRIRGLISIWLILMTSHVFFTGVTLARGRLRSGASAGQRIAWLPVLVTLGAVLTVLADVGLRIWAEPIMTANEAVGLIVDVSSSGLSHIVLLPFIALVRPLFAESFQEFALVLPAAVAIYAATIVWVLRADEAFGEVAQDLAEARDNRPAKKVTAYQARPVGWTLALEGRSETAFVWKAALQTFRIVDRRVLMRGAFVLAWMTVAVALFSRARGLAQGLGVFAAFGSAFVIFFGPQVLRIDLRQDLQHLELLKTWPAPAAAVVRGEIAWPATVITCLAWTFGAVAMFLSAAAFSRTGLSWRMAGGAAGMILAPALVLAQYTIHNATALMFPAWIPVGGARPRGVDAMGQRLIMLGGTWIMLVLAMAPGAIAGGVLWLAFYRFLGPWILIPAAAVAATIVIVEVLMATEALGPAYERLDITSVERGE